MCVCCLHWPLRKHAPLCVTTPNLVTLGQTLVRNYGDHPEKFDLSRPVLQGHSTSLELTQIDQPPMTSCYCSIVTMGLSRTVFEISGNLSKKNFHPLYFTPSVAGFPLEFM